jgi:hypothetical protein
LFDIERRYRKKIKSIVAGGTHEESRIIEGVCTLSHSPRGRPQGEEFFGEGTIPRTGTPRPDVLDAPSAGGWSRFREFVGWGKWSFVNALSIPASLPPTLNDSSAISLDRARAHTGSSAAPVMVKRGDATMLKEMLMQETPGLSGLLIFARVPAAQKFSAR